MGKCVDPPLCRGTSPCIYGWKIIGLVCKGETVGKIREVDEMGERELVLVFSVRCVDDNCLRDTKMCNPEPSSS